MFGDVCVDATESQLLVLGRGDGLDNQLCIGIRWLGLILAQKKKIDTSLNKHGFIMTHSAFFLRLNINSRFLRSNQA